MNRLALAVALATFALTGTARADDLCVDRPGIATPPCTLPAGRVMVEVGAVGWDHTSDGASREDDLGFGDLLVRAGIGGSTELSAGFGGWGHQRVRERASGRVDVARGAGDVLLGVRHGFGNGNDSAVALAAFVTLPTGRTPIGAGKWTAGAKLPVSLPFAAGFDLSLTPEIDATPDADGSGHHATWGSVIGVSHGIGERVSAGVELAAYRDDDPAEASTDARAAFSAAWRAGRSLQVDIELDLGLSSGAPDHALMIGFARQF